MVNPIIRWRQQQQQQQSILKLNKETALHFQSRRISMRFHLLCVRALLVQVLVLLFPISLTTTRVHVVNAKTIETDFQLSRSTTEAVVGAFCVSPHKRGHLKFQLLAPWPRPRPRPKQRLHEEGEEEEEDKSSQEHDETQQQQQSQDDSIKSSGLTLRLYRDDNWTSYETATSCTDRAQFAIQNQAIVTTNATATTTTTTTATMMMISMNIPNSKQPRAHYYYAVITDCSLRLDESFLETNHNEAAAPMTITMPYRIEFTNNGSHLSADELHLNVMHMVTLFVSGTLATLLALKVLIQFYEQKHTVHAAVLWVMAAAASDSLASLLAIIHLELYAHNGIGSPWLDALSCHLEATCDSLVALLLLSIGAGWTLPSDQIKANHTLLQKIMQGLSSPFCSCAEQGVWSHPAAVLASFIFVSHVLLAQWGLHYHNNDFDSYHDLEHLPGKTLMALRMMLGFGLWICCAHTKQTCPICLVSFYNQLALVGTLWFESLPLLTWIVNSPLVAFHLRHRTIGVWGAFLQMISIALLSWLVTAHSSSQSPYHKLSHVSAPAHDSLTERLSAAAGEGFRTWTTLGGKAKIRLD